MQIKPADIDILPDGRVKSGLYGDIYFSCPDEARYVFLHHNMLEARFQAMRDQEVFRIGELGFGTGLNFFLTWKLWRETAPDTARLVFVSVEKHPLTQEDFRRVSAQWPDLKPLTAAFANTYPDFTPGIHTRTFDRGRVTLMIYFDDAKSALADLKTQIDAWFPDGFVPRNNPGMWQPPLFRHMARLSHKDTTFATFTSAGDVRRGLAAAGFRVEKTKGFGPKRDMLKGGYTQGEKMRGSARPVTVIGAGIAGCALSFALARKGHCVTLFERHKDVAQEASGNPVGIIYPKLGRTLSATTLFYLHAFNYTRHILTMQNLDAGFVSCGVMTLDINDARRDKHRAIADLGLPESCVRYLDAAGASAVAGVTLDTPALFQPQAGYLDPRKFCRALIDAAGDRLETRFGEIPEKQEGLTILATGADAGRSLHGFHAPVSPVRGQVSFLPETETSWPLGCVLNHKGYIAPAINGVHCFGATFRQTTDTGITAEDHAENLANLKKHLPELAGCVDPENLKGRAALRAATPDRLPVAGKIPDMEDLYILGGLGSHGLTTAALCAEIIAAQPGGDPLPVPQNVLAAIDPARFTKKENRKSA